MNLRTFSLLAFLPTTMLPHMMSQTTTLATSELTAVPPLVPYSGQVEGRTGHASITFLIYKDQQGGEPVFAESQVIGFDSSGRYKVQLGAANSHGLPLELFATGEARWLEIQIPGQEPQPRVLLASVPYAIKAADAATLGGLPASAFSLAGSNRPVATPQSVTASPDAGATVTTSGGTANQLAKFSGSSTIVKSLLYDNGRQVGIGTATPSATLTVTGSATVNGSSTLNGQVVLPATGAATASKSYNSQYLKFYASAYNSSSKSTVPPRFQLQAEPTGNNTASPNGTLNLLASGTSSAPAETGLYFNTDGTLHFAPGQTFEATSNNVSQGPAFSGLSNDGWPGISGGSNGTTPGTAGVSGIDTNLNGQGIGVFGGNTDANSQTGLLCKSQKVGAGVWGDSSYSISYSDTPAVIGTADDQFAGLFLNNSESAQALRAVNDSQTTNALAAYLGGIYGGCSIDTSGDLFCTGSKSAVVSVENNKRKVALYAVESPENWFEDFGSGHLSNGVATVNLEPIFAQTVNLAADYHVFLTPSGDSKGLYVSSKSPTSFEVREAGSGRSTLAFDYRIVARRKGYESIRLADKTRDLTRAPLGLAANKQVQAK